MSLLTFPCLATPAGLLNTGPLCPQAWAGNGDTGLGPALPLGELLASGAHL